MRRSAQEVNLGLGCPYCDRGNRSRVVDSRDNPTDKVRRRRHECENCQKRFTTYEISAVEYEKIQALKVKQSDLDRVIAFLRAVKVQFGESNGHQIKN